LAEERGVRSISFPAISTGIYGYPAQEAAVIALREVRKHLEREDVSVETVVFVLFGKSAFDVYAGLLSSV
jgi:O-acetyl-ADP-ribose deacetylase (regulator of RNase III)